MTKNYPSYKSIKSIFFPPVQLTQRNYQKIAKFLFALLVTDLQHSIGSVKKVVMEMVCLIKTQDIECWPDPKLMKYNCFVVAAELCVLCLCCYLFNYFLKAAAIQQSVCLSSTHL